MAAMAATFTRAPALPRNRLPAAAPRAHHNPRSHAPLLGKAAPARLRMACKAAETAAALEGEMSWVPVVPVTALPRGERRVILQDGEAILLLWYKDQVYAIENRSPAEGAYSEGLLNAKLTQVNLIINFLILYHFFLSIPRKKK
jgi:hypothetical protein